MADITRLTATTFPNFTGVPQATLDQLTQALASLDLLLLEVNASGGDGMSARVPTTAQMTFIPDNIQVADTFSDVKAGAHAWADASTTHDETLAFTADGVVVGASSVGLAKTLASISGTTLTIARTTTTNGQITSWLAWQSD